MKIAILTQPLYFNYGGILQAYALYCALQDLGHEVWIINRVDSYSHGFVYRSLSTCKIILKECLNFLLGKTTYSELQLFFANSQRNTFAFVTEYIQNRSGELHSDKELRSFIKKMDFDAYVVGSDQVWRPKYSPNIYTYFLDFSSDNTKKISYAASFGVDCWEYSSEETLVCSNLLQKFDAVSVREESAISLCAEYLNRSDARLVLDPTLLHTSDFYLALIRNKNLSVSDRKYLLSYILDINEEKQNLMNNINSVLQLPLYAAQEGLLHKNKLATIEEWLYGFANAKFAVIDSFHGCVFAIIFHVPFIVVANKERGISRFKSLLSLFHLESRLLLSTEEYSEDMLHYDFCWDTIDARVRELREQSYNFLLNSLKSC